MIGKGNRSGFIKSSSMAGDQLSSSSLSPQSSPVPRIRHTQPARTRLSPRNNNEDTTDTSDDNIFFRSNRDQKSFKKSSSMASDQFSMSSISPRTSPNMRKRHAQSSRSRITKRDYSPDNNSVNKTGEDNLSLKSTEEQSSHSTYVLLLTSADRLELTVTPSALKTIQMYSQVCYYIHVHVHLYMYMYMYRCTCTCTCTCTGVHVCITDPLCMYNTRVVRFSSQYQVFVVATLISQHLQTVQLKNIIHYCVSIHLFCIIIIRCWESTIISQWNILETVYKTQDHLLE